jgi:HK97 family phage prohead protease
VNHETIAELTKLLAALSPPEFKPFAKKLARDISIKNANIALDDLRRELACNSKRMKELTAQLSEELADFSLAPPLIEIKKSSQGVQVSGYASTFGPPPDDQNEIIDAGAYTATIMQHLQARTMPVMLFGHDQNKPIGTWQTMSEDRHGLKVSGVILSSVRKGAEAISLIEAKAINGLSVGFRCKKDQRIAGIRHLQAVDLIEISCVALPSAPLARLAITGKEL